MQLKHSHLASTEDDHWKPTYGIDVSEHVTPVPTKTWEVYCPPIEFAYIKMTEGATRVDHHYSDHIRDIPERIVKGGYHYGYPQADRDPVKDAEGEASWFARALDGYMARTHLSLQPVLDWEHGAWKAGVNGISDMSMQQREDWITAFVHKMKYYGHLEITIYVGVSVWHRSITDGGRDLFEKQPLWIAQYPLGDKELDFSYAVHLSALTLPSFGDVVNWQYTGTGKLHGFKKDEHLDFNRLVDVEGFGWYQLDHDIKRGAYEIGKGYKKGEER